MFHQSNHQPFSRGGIFKDKFSLFICDRFKDLHVVLEVIAGSCVLSVHQHHFFPCSSFSSDMHDAFNSAISSKRQTAGFLQLFECALGEPGFMDGNNSFSGERRFEENLPSESVVETFAPDPGNTFKARLPSGKCT